MQIVQQIAMALSNKTATMSEKMAHEAKAEDYKSKTSLERRAEFRAEYTAIQDHIARVRLQISNEHLDEVRTDLEADLAFLKSQKRAAQVRLLDFDTTQ